MIELLFLWLLTFFQPICREYVVTDVPGESRSVHCWFEPR